MSVGDYTGIVLLAAVFYGMYLYNPKWKNILFVVFGLLLLSHIVWFWKAIGIFGIVIFLLVPALYIASDIILKDILSPGASESYLEGQQYVSNLTKIFCPKYALYALAVLWPAYPVIAALQAMTDQQCYLFRNVTALDSLGVLLWTVSFIIFVETSATYRRARKKSIE